MDPVFRYRMPRRHRLPQGLVGLVLLGTGILMHVRPGEVQFSPWQYKWIVGPIFMFAGTFMLLILIRKVFIRWSGVFWEDHVSFPSGAHGPVRYSEVAGAIYCPSKRHLLGRIMFPDHAWLFLLKNKPTGVHGLLGKSTWLGYYPYALGFNGAEETDTPPTEVGDFLLRNGVQVIYLGSPEDVKVLLES